MLRVSPRQEISIELGVSRSAVTDWTRKMPVPEKAVCCLQQAIPPPNGQISDTVATSVVNGRIIRHENRLRLRHVFVRNAIKVSSPSMVGIASALSSAGAKPDPGVTIKRGKR